MTCRICCASISARRRARFEVNLCEDPLRLSPIESKPSPMPSSRSGKESPNFGRPLETLPLDQTTRSCFVQVRVLYCSDLV
jgi:hypothetical protein